MYTYQWRIKTCGGEPGAVQMSETSKIYISIDVFWFASQNWGPEKTVRNFWEPSAFIFGGLLSYCRIVFTCNASEYSVHQMFGHWFLVRTSRKMIKQMSKYFVGISEMFEEEKSAKRNKQNANCFEFAKLDKTEAPWWILVLFECAKQGTNFCANFRPNPVLGIFFKGKPDREIILENMKKNIWKKVCNLKTDNFRQNWKFFDFGKSWFLGIRSIFNTRRLRVIIWNNVAWMKRTVHFD